MSTKHHEQRVEYATERGTRKAVRRSVKLPGEGAYSATMDDPALIARRIQLGKIEKRAKRS